MKLQPLNIGDLTFQPYISASEIREKVEEMGQQIRERHAHSNPLFLVILNGAFIFAADLVRACQVPCEITFTRLSSYEGLSSTGQVETLIELNEDIKGRPIIIVEDIIDTGKTLSHFLPILQKSAPSSIEIAAFLVKREAMEYPLKIDYWGYEIPNDFVIGYGLDFDEKGRELPAIYQKVD